MATINDQEAKAQYEMGKLRNRKWLEEGFVDARAARKLITVIVDLQNASQRSHPKFQRIRQDSSVVIILNACSGFRPQMLQRPISAKGRITIGHRDS